MGVEQVEPRWGVGAVEEAVEEEAACGEDAAVCTVEAAVDTEYDITEAWPLMRRLRWSKDGFEGLL